MHTVPSTFKLHTQLPKLVLIPIPVMVLENCTLMSLKLYYFTIMVHPPLHYHPHIRYTTHARLTH